MQHKDDWFRRPCLTPIQINEFEAKLSRARSSRHEYMRIQAGSLAKAGEHLAAIALIDRVILEDPDSFALAWLFEGKAASLRQLGDQKSAILWYQKSIQRMKERPSAIGGAHIEYPFWVACEKMTEHYSEAFELSLQVTESDHLFPITAFQRYATTALIASDTGDDAAAEAAAKAALAWAAKSQSNASKHRNIGLVGDQYFDIQNRLREICGLSSLKNKNWSRAGLVRLLFRWKRED